MHYDTYLQAEVFGKQLKPGEFEKLAADVQAEKSDEMMDVIRRRLEDRREENLKKGPANGGLRMWKRATKHPET